MTAQDILQTKGGLHNAKPKSEGSTYPGSHLAEPNQIHNV